MDANLTLKQVIQNAINEVDFDAIVTNKVQEEVERTVKEVIKDQFTWRGPIKNQIEEEFKRSGTVNLEELGILGLSSLMSDAIVEATNELIKNETKENVQKYMYRGLANVSKVNDINKLVDALVSDLNEKVDCSDEDISGRIEIRYEEVEDQYYSYKSCYWYIDIVDGENVEDETIRISVSSINSRKMYSVRSERIDKLQPILDALERVEILGLEIRIEKEEFCFSNYYG